MNVFKSILSVLVFGGVLLVPASPARANADVILRVDPDAASGGDGTSWARAFNDLQAALVAARGVVAGQPATVFKDSTQEAFCAPTPPCDRPGYFQWSGIPKPTPEEFSFAAGGAVGDFNKDGWQDLFVLGGGGGSQPLDKLFMNKGLNQEGKVTFTNEAQAAGVARAHVGIGAAVADVNGDGWLDIYVTSFGNLSGWEGTNCDGSTLDGCHLLYINHGVDSNGQLNEFTEEAHAYGIAGNDPGGGNPYLRSAFGAAFGDYDLDGDLDLAVAVYQNRAVRFFEFDAMASRFTEKTDEIIPDSSNMGFSLRFVDLTGDRYPELLVAMDFGNSRLFVNVDRDGKRVLLDSRAATCGTLEPIEPFVCGIGGQGFGMGNTVGDYNGDGRLDWLYTSIYSGASPGNSLWIDSHPPCEPCDQSFVDEAALRGVADGGFGWGAISIDADHDGDVDIVETNGGVALGCLPGSEHCSDPSYYFENIPDPTEGFIFQRIDLDESPGDNARQSGRGIVNFDYDNDGDQDVVVFHINLRHVLWENTTIDGAVPTGRNFLRVLLDTCSLPDLAPNGFGTRLIARTGCGGWDGPPMVRVIDGGCNHVSQSELSAHFGLGDATNLDLRVEWADGFVTELPCLSINQTLVLKRDECEGLPKVQAVASRFIRISPPKTGTVALRVTNLCTTEQGWVTLTPPVGTFAAINYDDGPQGLVNVGVTVADCASAEFHDRATWLGLGNKLVVTGDIIAPNTLFQVEAVSGNCTTPIFSVPGVTPHRTWVYSDASGDGQVTYNADLSKMFNNTAASGFPLWTGPDPGYEVDTQGQGLPDGQVTFFVDVFLAFQASAAAGCTGYWQGTTCCTVAADCHPCESGCSAGECLPP
ncbi:MAG: CRTAC1 family protein [Phycisphaerae bacterium]